MPEHCESPDNSIIHPFIHSPSTLTPAQLSLHYDQSVVGLACTACPVKVYFNGKNKNIIIIRQFKSTEFGFLSGTHYLYFTFVNQVYFKFQKNQVVVL